MKPFLTLNIRSMIVLKSRSLAPCHGIHPSLLQYTFKPVHPPLFEGLRGTIQGGNLASLLSSSKGSNGEDNAGFFGQWCPQ